MEKQKQSSFLNDFYFSCRFAAIFAVPFLTLLASCLVANTQKVSAVIDAELYHLEMTTPEYVNIDVHPGPNGSIAIGASNILVTSTTPGGFGLYLSGSNTLFRNGDNTITDADKKIISTTGTYGLPTALISNSTTPATWGYAVAGLGNFDESYSVSSPSMTAKFAAVPATNSEQLIKAESSTVSNDTTTVYYGINANTNLTSGEYISGAVSYYSVADISSLIGGELTVSPNFITPGQENAITITTSLNTQMDVGVVDVTVGSYSCTSQTITSTTPLTISCTLPATVPQGHYDVEVNVPRFGRNYASENALHVLMAMQNINADFVATMNTDEQYQMYDLRDGKIYFVSKLQDGNVWMTQNLDFEVPATGYTFDPETTYVSSPRTITPAATWGTDRNGYYYKDGGDVYYAPSGNFENNDSPQPLDNLAPDAEERHYSAGSYYSYAMASLGDSINGSETSYGYIDNFICPKGWIIPNYTYEQRYSPQILLTKYNIINPGNSMGSSNLALHQEPLYFARTGYYDGVFKDLGVYGGIWERYYNYAAQYQGGNISYIPYGNSLSFDAAQISTYSSIGMNYSRREYGLSVRCVAVSPSRYAVHYDANGGKLKNSDASVYNTYASSWGAGEHGVALVRSPTMAGRVGFTPIGFAETPDATEPQYYVNDLIDLTQDKTLYVIWEFEPIYQAYHDAGLELNSDGYYTMQDMTPEICAAVPTPDRYTTISSRLQDTRDGKLYYVSKLADGDCWMTQNLDFEIPTTGITLSPSTSAVLSEKTITATETYSDGMNSIVYYDGGDRNVYAGTDTLNETNNPDYDYSWHYHVGSYYTYNAATAGSGQTASSNAIESICPKGWRLPAGRVYEEAKSFGKLTETYGYTTNGTWTSGTNSPGANMRYNPLYFQLSGYYLSSGLNTYRSSGLYWSATSYGGATNPHAYYMSFSNNVNIAHSNEKYVGGSVRCVQGGPHNFAIHYDANGGNTAPADTTTLALSEGSTRMTITSEKPVNGDLTFLGWATTADAKTPEYAAGNNINVPLEGITLYAVWDQFDIAFKNAGLSKQNYAINPNNGEGKFFRMQDMTPEICAAIPTPTTIAETPFSNLIDVRDNVVYLVSKYADGNCWMTQNLDYRINYPVNEGGGRTLYPDTSDVSVAKRYVENNPKTSDPHNRVYWDFWDRQFSGGKGGLIYMTGTPHNGINYRYHSGNLYSFDVAAMYFTDEDVANGYVNNSVCPRGWTLPRLSGEQSFTGLINAYNLKVGSDYGDGDDIDEPLKAPLYLTRAGKLPAGTTSVSDTGSAGYYWTRTLMTSDDVIYAGSLTTSGSVLSLGFFDDLADARSVRCVVKDNPEKLVTFAVNNPEYGEFTESVVAVPAGTTFTTSGDTITFSNGITSQVKPKTVYGYFIAFDSWEVESGTITENTTIQANVRWHLAFNGIETMQEMTPEICAAAEENETLRPFDTRDNERYWITKLADGRCWMTEDLDFAIASEADGGTTLDPATSNVSTSKTINSDSTAGSTYRIRRETSVGDGGEITRYIARNNGTASNYYNGVDTPFDSTEWHYRLGTFYGYGVATAGSGDNITSGNATESICPKGWYLPSAGYVGADFNTLNDAYGLNMWETNGDRNAFLDPLYFYRNGWVDAGQANVTDRGNYGLWRSSTASGGSAYNGLAVYGVRQDGPHSRAILYSVRCIAETE